MARATNAKRKAFRPTRRRMRDNSDSPSDTGLVSMPETYAPAMNTMTERNMTPHVTITITMGALVALRERVYSVHASPSKKRRASGALGSEYQPLAEGLRGVMPTGGVAGTTPRSSSINAVGPSATHGVQA
jgi:hypothetical protein